MRDSVLCYSFAVPQNHGLHKISRKWVCADILIGGVVLFFDIDFRQNLINWWPTPFFLWLHQLQLVL